MKDKKAMAMGATAGFLGVGTTAAVGGALGGAALGALLTGPAAPFGAVVGGTIGGIVGGVVGISGGGAVGAVGGAGAGKLIAKNASTVSSDDKQVEEQEMNPLLHGEMQKSFHTSESDRCLHHHALEEIVATTDKEIQGLTEERDEALQERDEVCHHLNEAQRELSKYKKKAKEGHEEMKKLSDIVEKQVKVIKGHEKTITELRKNKKMQDDKIESLEDKLIYLTERFDRFEAMSDSNKNTASSCQNASDVNSSFFNSRTSDNEYERSHYKF